MPTLAPSIESTTPVWKLTWLTPIRCRIILAVLLLAGAAFHVWYLNDNCPIDLSGDEAQYWDWSRNLDISYYSKGPLIAYIIRASCAIFGETMPAIRYPAILLGIGTSLVTYLLTRKLFGSEKLALGAVLLVHIVPMFVAGSVLMTIDPAMFFCWGLATYLTAIAVLDNRAWLWPIIGLVLGIGFLAKYAVFLWFIGMAGFLIFEARQHRFRALSTAAVAVLFTIPVILWNARHDWVSYRHVAKQTGASDGNFNWTSPLEMVGIQFAALGPTTAILMVAAVILAIRTLKKSAIRTQLALLLWIGLPFWILNFLTSFRTKVQPNWPVASYFTLIILTAWFLGVQLQSMETWKRWRGFLYASIVIGLIANPLAHDSSVLFPLVKPFVKPDFRYSRLDIAARLRGWAGLGNFVSEQLATLPQGSFVLCHDYQQTAEMAFYVNGQPKTYCAGPYLDLRLSQYDMWPNRRLDGNPDLLGRDAVYVSRVPSLPEGIKNAFERIEPTDHYVATARGETIRGHGVWKCYGFKGMKLRDAESRGY